MRICFAVVFVLFFLFFVFFRPPKLWDNRSRERLNGFSWNFYQTIGGNVIWNVVPPLGESHAAAWRMANVDDLRHLRYDSFAITRGRHVIYAMTLVESPECATGGCVIQNERANWCNLVFWEPSPVNNVAEQNNLCTRQHNIELRFVGP